MTIGEKIKHRRQELKLTQEELAKKLGVTKSAVCRIERGFEPNPTTDRIKKYAEALDCSISYMMGWNDDVPSDDEVSEHIELIDLYEQLTRSQKDHIIATMKLLIKE